MSVRNKLKHKINKIAQNKANAVLRNTIFRLARQRDILGIVVIFETFALVALCIFFSAYISAHK